MKQKKFAILGYGTVGSGVAEVWSEFENAPLALGYILVRRPRPGDPFEAYMTEDFSVIENDPDVAVVAEVIGGTDAAYDYSRRALAAGKSVVSSNKALVAAHGAELCALAEEHGCAYLYEASVAGGIPLLRPLTRCLAANRVDELCGILNGTTNFILSAMKRERQSFAQALAAAQALGYAEADPTADVEGLDAARKTAILASLCFGRRVDPEAMSVRGVTQITPADLELAQALGFELKLLGRVRREGEQYYAFVEPHLVPQDRLLASVEGVMNACMLRASAAGELLFYGPGAGKRPTASAVCGDLCDAAAHPGERMTLSPEPCRLADPAALPACWYVRAACEPGRILAAFPDARPVYGADGSCGFLTGPAARDTLSGALAEIGAAAVYRVLA